MPIASSEEGAHGATPRPGHPNLHQRLHGTGLLHVTEQYAVDAPVQRLLEHPRVGPDDGFAEVEAKPAPVPVKWIVKDNQVVYAKHLVRSAEVR